MKHIYLMILAMTLAHSSNTFAAKDRGGGNGVELDFKGTGQRIVDELNTLHIPYELRMQLSFRPQDLRAAINSTNIVATNEVLLLNDEKVVTQRDAINYPPMKIIRINEASWSRLNERQKRALALHEYLGIMGIDDANYQVSSAYFSLLSNKRVEDQMKANDECRNAAVEATSEAHKKKYRSFCENGCGFDPEVEPIKLPGVNASNQRAGAFLIKMADEAGESMWLAVVDLSKKKCKIESITEAAAF